MPADPAVLLAGLRDGTVRLEGMGRTDADQVSAMAYAAAVLVAGRGLSAAPPVEENDRNRE